MELYMNKTESHIQNKVESTISAFKDTFLNYTYPFDKEVSIQYFFYRHLMEDEKLILKSEGKYFVELVKPEFKIHKQVPYKGYYDLVILNPEYVSYVLDREKNYIRNENHTIKDQFCYADVLANYYYDKGRSKDYLQPAMKNKNILYCFEFKYLANNHQKANDIIYGFKNNGKNCVKNDIERLRESVDFGIKYPVCIFVSNSNAGVEHIGEFRKELSDLQDVSVNNENKVRVIIIESCYASPHNKAFKSYTEYYV